jgi:putative ABC transport system substrate-binding protein
MAQKVLEFGKKHNMPVGANAKMQVPLGGLLCLTTDTIQIGQATAVQADKIFKGASPATLPVETAELYLTVNLKAAQSLNLTVPDIILKGADEIVR